MRPSRPTVSALLAAFAFAALIGACSSGGSDPATAGPRKQATEKLHAFGLTSKQASCVVDKIGAQTIVEATDLNAFADSQQYRDAADACIDGH